MRRSKKIILLFLVAALMFTGCGLLPAEKSTRKMPVEKTDTEERTISTAIVERGDVTDCITAECVYGSQKSESLSFNTGNEPILGIYVKEGDAVYAGELLAEIATGTLDDEIEECKRICKQTDTDLAYYTQKLAFETERQQIAKRYGRKFETKTLDDLADKKAVLEGEKKVADLRLAEAEKQLKGRRLVASFDGVVTYLRPMRMWERSNTQTFIIIRSADTGFMTSLDDVYGFSVGEMYQLESGNDIIPCTLASVTESTTVKDRSNLIFIPLEAGLEIEDGTRAYVKIFRQEAKGVLFIPTDAVRTIGGRTAVYVQNSDGMREIRYIEIGLSVKGLPEKSLNRTEVISGLSEGEIIIIR